MRAKSSWVCIFFALAACSRPAERLGREKSPPPSQVPWGKFTPVSGDAECTEFRPPPSPCAWAASFDAVLVAEVLGFESLPDAPIYSAGSMHQADPQPIGADQCGANIYLPFVMHVRTEQLLFGDAPESLDVLLGGNTTMLLQMRNEDGTWKASNDFEIHTLVGLSLFRTAGGLLSPLGTGFFSESEGTMLFQKDSCETGAIAARMTHDEFAAQLADCAPNADAHAALAAQVTPVLTDGAMCYLRAGAGDSPGEGEGEGEGEP